MAVISAGAKVGTPATKTALEVGVQCCAAGHGGLITWLLEQNTVGLGDAAASCLALQGRTETVRMQLQEAHRLEAVAMQHVSTANSNLVMARAGAAAASLVQSRRLNADGTYEQRSPAEDAALALVAGAEGALRSAEAELQGIRREEIAMGRELKSMGDAASLLEVYAAGHAALRKGEDRAVLVSISAPAAPPPPPPPPSPAPIINVTILNSGGSAGNNKTGKGRAGSTARRRG